MKELADNIRVMGGEVLGKSSFVIGEGFLQEVEGLTRHHHTAVGDKSFVGLEMISGYNKVVAELVVLWARQELQKQGQVSDMCVCVRVCFWYSHP